MSRSTKLHGDARSRIISRARQLRRAITPAEHTLWQRLRDHQLAGHSFRRQHPIGPFVVDFFCARGNLIIEIDGHSHGEPSQQRVDMTRSAWLISRGYRVIRFTNEDVAERLEGVLMEIIRALEGNG